MKRRGREFWTGTVAEYEGSGMTQQAFAARRGLAAPTLRGWIYKLRDERPRASILPVRVVASTAPTARRASDAGEVIEVTLPTGVRAAVTVGTDPVYAAALIRCLLG